MTPNALQNVLQKLLTEKLTSEVLVTQAEVARLTGRSQSALWRDRHAGTGIPWLKLGKNVRYDMRDVVAYLEQAKKQVK